MLGDWLGEKINLTEQGHAAVSPSIQDNGLDQKEDFNKAVESLGRILRSLGRHAFEMDERSEEEIEKDFERWAMHVLVGSSIRDEHSEGEPIQRDWGELTKFVNRHRQQEKQYIERNLQDVRNVLWEFTNSVGRAVVEDQESDQQVSNYLEQLRVATEAGTFNEVKQALLSVVQGMNTVVDERKKRQRLRIQRLGEKLRSVEQELGSVRKEMALDSLTKLYNRGALDLQLERTASISFFSESVACILMVDIDHFKHINDTYGHQAGDAVIQQLSDRLVSTFPRKGDFVARYGGEEFCVLLSGATLKVCQRLGERLVETVRKEVFQYQDISIPATVSVGVAEIIHGETVPVWLERADQALYRAKNNGRNQVCLALETVDAV